MDDMYGDFAYIYDKLMYDVDYPKWVSYIEDIFTKLNTKPKLVLDLGCGTGNICIEMSKKGYDMIGVDISSDMLCCAKDKVVNQKEEILFIKQDMCDFELYGSIDAVLCIMDSVNYITSKNKLNKMFKTVEKYLNPGGVFIFDINTEYKLEHTLGNNVFYDITDEYSYIWQNNYDKRKKICEFDLTFFVKEMEKYSKWDETHLERAYSSLEIKDIIKKSGLQLKFVFDELKFTKPKKTSERVFFVCQKI